MIVFNNLVFEETWLEELFSQKENLAERISYIRGVFGFKDRVRVLAFNTVGEMADYFGFALPEWIKGTGYGDKVLVVRRQGWIQDFEDSLFTIVLHEFVHRAVERSFAAPCPRWLNEGLAVNLSGELALYDLSRCQEGYAYYDKGYEDGLLFYTHSALMVSRLFAAHGAAFLVGHCRSCRDFLNDTVVGKVRLAKIPLTT